MLSTSINHSAVKAQNGSFFTKVKAGFSTFGAKIADLAKKVDLAIRGFLASKIKFLQKVPAWAFWGTIAGVLALSIGGITFLVARSRKNTTANPTSTT